MKSKGSAFDPIKGYGVVVLSLSSEAGVSVGAGTKKGFGATALTVNGKIFAMLSSKNALVVKLASARVDELVDAGQGLRFEGSRGRPMKEWLEVKVGQESSWCSFAREAYLHAKTQKVSDESR